MTTGRFYKEGSSNTVEVVLIVGLCDNNIAFTIDPNEVGHVPKSVN